MTDSYNLARLLQSEAFGRVVEELHREYYESWRRETDPVARDRIGIAADVLDDVISIMQMRARDSDDEDDSSS